MAAQVIRLEDVFPQAEAPKPRPFGCVRPRGRTLYVHFRYRGRTVEKSTGLPDDAKSRDRARALLDRIAAAIKDESFRFAEVFPGASEEEKKHFSRLEGWEFRHGPEDVTFGAYLDRWTAKNLRGDPSATKRRDYGAIIGRHLRERFGALPFSDLNGLEVVRFVQELREKGLSSSRIRNVLIPLRVVWEDACVEYGWGLADPFQHLKRRNRGGRLIPKRRKNPPEVFRWEEWRAVLAALDPWHRPIAELMVMTGMIHSELGRLTMADVSGDRLRVRGTKTEYREREMPVTAALRRVLRELEDRAKDGQLVTRPDGRALCPVRFRNGPWKKALADAGVPYRRPYAMRHTFAIWRLVTGTHPERMVKLMGHGSKQMVYEVYGRYTEGLETDADAIREYLGEVSR